MCTKIASISPQQIIWFTMSTPRELAHKSAHRSTRLYAQPLSSTFNQTTIMDFQH